MIPDIYSIPIYESKLVPKGGFLKILDPVDRTTLKAIVVNDMQEFIAEVKKQNEANKEKQT